MPPHKGNPNLWISSACRAGNHKVCAFPRECECCRRHYDKVVAAILVTLAIVVVTSVFVILSHGRG